MSKETKEINKLIKNLEEEDREKKLSKLGKAKIESAKARMKFKKRLVITVCSIMATLCVMAVGVLATLREYEVSISNAVSLTFQNVEGTLQGKRTGQVIYSDANSLPSGKALNDDAITEWLSLYDTASGTYGTALSDIQAKVNFGETTGHEDTGVRITYEYKYVHGENAVGNTKATLLEPALGVENEQVQAIYKYKRANTDLSEPIDWSDATTMSESNGVVVEEGNQRLYILCELYVDLSKSINLSNCEWAYTLEFSGTTEEAPAMLPSPSITIEGNTLRITPVPDAVGYDVYEETTKLNTEPITTTTYTIEGETTPNTTQRIYAVAKGDETTSLDSLKSEPAYKIAEPTEYTTSWDIAAGDNNLKAYLSGTGVNKTLTILGGGEMEGGLFACSWSPFCDSITAVDMSSCFLKNIGAFSFIDCVNLSEITIPDSVTSIDEAAFVRC